MKTIVKTIRKAFGGLNMTWPTVLIMSVASALLTALFLIIPVFEGTSFENPGVYLPMWFLLALLIISNCSKPLEAALKTFVFFLVSQPLIYLLQVPFSWMGWGLFKYYTFWFIVTVLTIPGAYLAWYVKKGTVFSALILSVALGFLTFELVSRIKLCYLNFPKQILSVIFILLEIIVFIVAFLRSKKAVIICLAVILIVGSVAVWFVLLKKATCTCWLEEGHNWSVERLEPENDIKVKITGERVDITFNSECSGKIVFSSDDGQTYTIGYSYKDNKAGIIHYEPFDDSDSETSEEG
ncbi:MAG: hypothetical protein J5850_04100 [Clostridia bacterium]|nr:hypothetical protein [Clostridia bacterium]